MSSGHKHLVRCRCVLPQFKKRANAPAHQFIVFSVVADDDTVVSKFVQCNNCGIIHKVHDICKSTIMQGREDMKSIVSLDEIKLGMPPNLVKVLELNNADVPTWEAAQFIIENQKWGDYVTLSSDSEDGLRQGKYIRILGENLYKVDSYSREET